MNNFIESFLEMMVAERGASANTIEAYSRDLSEFAAYAKRHRLAFETIEKPAIEKYITTLGKSDLSAKTIARRISSIRQFFHFLYSEDIRKDDPATNIDSPKQTRSLPKSLSKDDIEKLITQARDYNDIRLVAILELLYASGLRVSELVTLPLVAFNKANQFLIVRGKGNKERLVALNNAAIEAVGEYISKRSHHSNYLFSSGSKEGHLTRQRLGQMLKELALKAGIDPEKISPHKMRHSFASHLLEGGADLRIIQELLGHSDISTTQIYTHIEQDKLTNLVRNHHPLSKTVTKTSHTIVK